MLTAMIPPSFRLGRVADRSLTKATPINPESVTFRTPKARRAGQIDVLRINETAKVIKIHVRQEFPLDRVRNISTCPDNFTAAAEELCHDYPPMARSAG